MKRTGLSTPPPFNIDAADLYCEWQHWVSSFDIYSVASELAEKDNKVQSATFLHCLGSTVQRIFRTLPGEHKKLADAKLALQNYFAPKQNVVSERYKFRSREQRPDEPIDSYLTALRELAKSCEFGTLEEEMIRDQIVEKCASKSHQKKLLTQDDLDLMKPMKVARSKETSRKHASMIAKGTKEDSSQLYNAKFKSHKLRPSKKRFTAYGQKDPLNCKGNFPATIKVGKKEVRANVYAIQGHSESLLGRDSSFNLEIISVNVV